MSARRATARFDPREGEPHVYTVGEIVAEIRDLLEGDYSRVLVRGEITDFSVSNGHMYFCLKDSAAQLKVAFFANRVRPSVPLQNGLSVQVEGKLTVYTNRGTMQLLADRVLPVGYGALQAKFEALKRRLHAEGLFTAPKKPLPRFPTRLAIVTSRTGAVIEDMLKVLREQAPHIAVILLPVRVQGAGASQEIANAIVRGDRLGCADVMIVARGGGSLEDLWPFNEEVVVRAVASTATPIISGVGHEVDVTLCDLAADFRAATPTGAAQEVAKSTERARVALDRLTVGVRGRMLESVRSSRRELNHVAAHRAFREPHRICREGKQSLDESSARLRNGLKGWVTKKRIALLQADSRARLCSPSQTLARHRDRLVHGVRRSSRALFETVTRSRARVNQARATADRAILPMTKNKADGVARLKSRLIHSGPSRRLEDLRRQLKASVTTLERASRREIDRGRSTLGQQKRLLVSFDYHDVLRRGYALVRSEEGHVVARGGTLVQGQEVEIRFLDAAVGATVTQTTPLREERDER